MRKTLKILSIACIFLVESVSLKQNFNCKELHTVTKWIVKITKRKVDSPFYLFPFPFHSFQIDSSS